MDNKEQEILVDQWLGCYRDAWSNIIVPAAMAHPAKFSRALVRSIYDHIEEEGWVVKGSTIIDPFGGVALGALEAMQRGLNWVGVELEPRFVRLGAGYDCPGFTTAQWRVYKAHETYARRSQGISPYAKYLLWLALRPGVDDRVETSTLCAQCLEDIKAEAEENPQSHLFAQPGEVAPAQEPHHFEGNLELWRRRAVGGTAHLLQGDSRRLTEVLSKFRLSENGHDLKSQDLSMSSPPYVSGGHHNDVMGAWNNNGGGHGVQKGEAGYGRAEGQMGQMKEGSVDLSLSSPPYEKTVKQRSGHLDVERLRSKGMDTSRFGRVAGQELSTEQYGQTEGQVGNLTAPDGSLEMALTSPPFGSTAHSDWHLLSPERMDRMFEAYRSGGGGLSREGFEEYCRSRQGGYGHSEGQLADMALTSPPYVGALGNARNFASSEAAEHESAREFMSDKSSTYTDLRYGSSEGQLGSMKEGDAELILSSPPYAGNSGKHDRTGHERAQRRHECLGLKQGVGCFKTSEAYGETEGQLGSLDTGDVDVVIGSPPYARSLMPDMNDPEKYAASEARYRENHPEHKRPKNAAMVYGNTPGNLGHITEGSVDAVIGSPPYADQNITGRRNFLGGGGNEQPANLITKREDGYGVTDGQMGLLPTGDLDAAISSPPYILARSNTTTGVPTLPYFGSEEEARLTNACNHKYGSTEGQLGAMPEGDMAVTSPPYPQPHTGGGGINVDGYQPDWKKRDMADLVGNRTYQARGGEREDGNLETMTSGSLNATISSPPFENGAEGAMRADKFSEGFANRRRGGHSSSIEARQRQLARENDRTYGDNPVNLGNMKGGFDQTLTSPPYEHDTEPHGDIRPDEGRQAPIFVERDYGATPGNISAHPETFWSAARVILEETYATLAPGAHAVFVVKAFVRDGKIVDFPGQWARLCQAVGFRWLHDHHAMLTEKYATQGGFEEDTEMESSRKSFFRRLHERKRPDLAIDFENVLCFVKE